MAQHIDIHATRWKRDGVASPSRVVVGIWGGLIVATLGLVILAAQFLIKNRSAEKPAATTYECPSLEGAKTIFIVVRKPSEKLLKDLEAALQNGTKIQLITTEAVTTSFNTTVVPENRIVRDAILVNGAAWYPLSP